ncbi:MAG TPA: diadenylate cyclase [Clostridia bacterium]|jgi:diadenylate cyclase
MNFLEKIADVLKSFNGWDALEIIVFALLFYGLFAFLKNANALRTLKYVAIYLVVLLFILNFKEKMPALYYVALVLTCAGVVVFFLAFIPETRRGLLKLITAKKTVSHFTVDSEISDEELYNAINEMIKAAQALSKSNTGALIVLVANAVPSHIVESGVKLNSAISAALLESIFNVKSPLHDGAVIIKGNKLIAAGCFLPLSQDTNLPKELGTRHRAAIGITENYDVLTIIVSEETGVISVAKNGSLSRYYDSDMLNQTLTEFYGLSVPQAETKKRRRK